MNRKIGNVIWIAACALLLLAPETRAYRPSDFHWLPPFLAMEEKPSLTFILDTSASMLERAYSDSFDAEQEYYGYFDPRALYSYNEESDTPHFFADNATGEWSGNFLNWAAMLRIDVARKVLTGGKFDTLNNCYEFEPLGHEAEILPFDDTVRRVDLEGRTLYMTPLHQTITIKVRDDDGLMFVSGPDFEERYDLRVKVESEDNRGLLQSVWDQAHLTLVTIEEGEPKRYPPAGYAGSLKEIQDAVNTLNPQGDAPLETTLHATYEIFRQNNGQNSIAADQFSELERSCSRQRVILVSSGQDLEKQDPGTECADLIELANQGANLALQDGMQNTNIYALCLAGSSSPLFPDAAKRQKFKEDDRIALPDNYFTVDSLPDLEKAITRTSLLNTPEIASGTTIAVSSQTRTGEGAAYQALFYPLDNEDRNASAWSGEVHAYLVDAQGNLREASGEKKTAGRFIELTEGKIYVHTDADDNGLIDEGERNATALDGLGDIEFLWSASTWLNKLTNDEAITQRSSYASVTPNRYIITFVDKNQDMTANANDGEIQDFALPAKPAEATLNSPDYFYNYLTLYESNSGTPRLDPDSLIFNLRNDDPSGFSAFQAELAKRQVDFIRGMDVGNATIEGIDAHTRNRAHGGTPWRLGDIVFSSPTVVGKPAENYHLIYNDTTYERFLTKYLGRRQVVYVGANDGMLHAFNGGFWNARTRTFDDERDGMTKFTLGQELWAYVPYNLLPHLRWLMKKEYEETLHVAYMDLTPRVFDARIFVMSDGVTSIDEARYPGGWGTILVAGMRMGGAAMEVDIDKTDGNAFNKDIDRTVSSAYVIMDVTDPESEPNVLAEISLPGQGFTTCVPAVMPMSSPDAKNADENKWYLVFGSGPADAAGRADRSKLMREGSDQPGKLFVLDLSALYVEKTVKTIDSTGLASSEGDAFAFVEAGSFISGPVCVDLDIPSKSGAGKFSTDLVYFGTVAGDSGSPAGKVYRLRTGNGPPDGWETSTLVDVGEPVSAAPSVAVDEKGSLWVYFGTGRFFNRDDIPQTAPMGFYGIREPEIAGTRSWDTVFTSLLCDSSKVAVTRGTCGEGEFSEDCVGIIQIDESSNATRDWAWLTSAQEQTPGWKQTFNAVGERVLGQAAVLGGSVVFTSVIPAQEICEARGASRLWSLYYKTGTPYFWPSLEHPGGNFPAFIELGQGLAARPTLHVGEKQTVKAFTPLTSGEISAPEIAPPLTFKSGPLFWRKNTY
jgi:type IV pilus assembly protein PilY1